MWGKEPKSSGVVRFIDGSLYVSSRTKAIDSGARQQRFRGGCVMYNSRVL